MAQALLIPLAIGIASAGVGAVASTLLAPKPSAAAVPTPTAPITMPTPDDAAVQKARTAEIISRQAASGRQSTILTPSSDKLGG